MMAMVAAGSQSRRPLDPGVGDGGGCGGILAWATSAATTAMGMRSM